MRSGVAVANASVIAVSRSTALIPRQKHLPIRVAVERTWVLHRNVVLKGVALALAVVIIAGAVQMRNVFFDAAGHLTEAASTGMASAGFGVAAIDITGQALTSETDIVTALAIAPHASLLAFDADAARLRVLALPAISQASIRKAYPDRLVVSVSEKAPIARWTVDGTTYLVDASGTRLVATESSEDVDLPLIIGQGAGDDAAVIIRALGLYPELDRGVFALSRIGDRRWDVLYDTGLRVQLPETGVTQALRRLDGLERDHSILEHDLSLIDLRVPDSTIVRLNDQKDDTSSN